MSTKEDRKHRSKYLILPKRFRVRQKDGSTLVQWVDVDVRVRKTRKDTFACTGPSGTNGSDGDDGQVCGA